MHLQHLPAQFFGFLVAVWLVAASIGGADETESYAEEFAAIFKPQPKLEFRRSQQLEKHNAPVVAVALSNDLTRAVSCSLDGDCRTWDLTTGRQLARFEKDLEGNAYCVAMTPDGKHALVGGQFNAVHVFDAATGKHAFSHEAPRAAITHVAVSDDGSWMIAADAGGVVSRYPLLGGLGNSVPIGDERRPFRYFAIPPDGSHALVGLRGKAVSHFFPSLRRLFGGSYDVSTKGSWVTCATFSERGAILIDHYGSVTQVYGLGTRRVPFSFKVQSPLPMVDQIRTTPDGGHFLALDYRGRVTLGETANIAYPHFFEIPVDAARSAAIGHDALTVAYGQRDGRIVVWELDERPVLAALKLAGLSQRLLEQEDFEALEALGKWLLANPNTLPRQDGDRQFGSLVANVGGRLGSDETNAALHKRLTAWIEENPESQLAQLALGEFHLHAAWQGRGGGPANTVTEDGWATFRSNIESAHKVLSPLMELQKKPADAYRQWFTIAMAQGWPREKVAPYVDQLVRDAPVYQPAHDRLALMMLPRWGGKLGESAEYARWACDTVGGDDGLRIYARTAMRLRQFFNDDDFFASTKFDYDRVALGALRILQQSPDDDEIISDALTLAYLQKDREFARKVVKYADNLDVDWRLESPRQPLYHQAALVWARQCEALAKRGDTPPEISPLAVAAPNPEPADALQPDAKPDEVTLRPVLETLPGKLDHDAEILRMKFSANGKLATVEYVGKICIWDVARKKLLDRIPAHTHVIFSLDWAPEGDLLASTSEDGTVRLWDADGKMELLGASWYPIRKMKISPDGRRIVWNESELQVFDRDSRRWLQTIPHDGQRFDEFEFAPDGKVLAASGGGMGSPAIFSEAGRGEPIARLKSRMNGAKAMAWSGDGQLLAIAGYRSRRVSIADRKTGRLVAEIKLKDGSYPTQMFFLADNRTLLSYHSRRIDIWDALTGRHWQEITEPLQSAAISADRKTLAIARNGSVTFSKISFERAENLPPFEVEPVRQPQPELAGGALPPRPTNPHPPRTPDAQWSAYATIECQNEPHFAVAADGRLAVATEHGIDLFNAVSGKLLLSIGGSGRPLAFGPEGNLYGVQDARIVYWDTKTGRRVNQREIGPPARRVDITPDGARMLLSGWGSAVIVLLPDLRVMHQLDLGDFGGMQPGAISPDGRTAAIPASEKSGGKAWELKLFDIVTGKRTGSIPDCDKIIGWHADGERIAVLRLQRVSIFNVRTGKTERFTDMKLHAIAAALSKNGDVLVTGHADGMIRVFDFEKRNLLAEFKGHDGTVNTVGFLPDGLGIYSKGIDRTIKLWSAKAGPKPAPSDQAEAKSESKRTVAPAKPQTASEPKGSAELDSNVPEPKRPKADQVTSIPTRPEELTWRRQASIVVNQSPKIALSAKGTLAVGDDTNTVVKLFDSTGRSLRTIVGRRSSIHSMSFSGDGKLYCLRGGRLGCYDEQTGLPVGEREIPFRGQILVGLKGTRLVVAQEKGVYIFTLPELNVAHKLDLEGEAVGMNGSALVHDGKIVAVPMAVKNPDLYWEAKLFDIETGKKIGGVPRATAVVAMHSDGETLVHKISSFLRITNFKTGQAHNFGGNSVVNYRVAAVDKTASLVATGDPQGGVRVYDFKKEAMLAEFPAAHQKFITHIGFFPNSAGFYTVSYDGVVNLWAAQKK